MAKHLERPEGEQLTAKQKAELFRQQQKQRPGVKRGFNKKLEGKHIGGHSSVRKRP